jgi:hypothetical protein
MIHRPAAFAVAQIRATPLSSSFDCLFDNCNPPIEVPKLHFKNSELISRFSGIADNKLQYRATRFHLFGQFVQSRNIHNESPAPATGDSPAPNHRYQHRRIGIFVRHLGNFGHAQHWASIEASNGRPRPLGTWTLDTHHRQSVMLDPRLAAVPRGPSE